jgi:hypothetical protein
MKKILVLFAFVCAGLMACTDSKVPTVNVENDSTVDSVSVDSVSTDSAVTSIALNKIIYGA